MLVICGFVCLDLFVRCWFYMVGTLVVVSWCVVGACSCVWGCGLGILWFWVCLWVPECGLLIWVVLRVVVIR